MKLLVLSDLHNEFESMQSDQDALAGADVVVLAGDIHTKDRSIQWAKEFVGDTGKPVVMIAGNHEFYGGHFDRTLDKLRDAARDTNVHFLEDDVVILGGVRFLGCTLWTDFKLSVGDASPATSMRDAQASMNDFRKIRATPAYRRLYPSDTVERHECSRAWLTNALQIPFKGRTVVITHHAPSVQSVEEQFLSDSLTPAYASDVESLMGSAVPLWIHGHMHASFDYMVGDTRVICNPRGYAPMHVNPEFNSHLTIEI